MNVAELSTRSIGDLLAIHAVRYVAASQAFAMVILHGGWILLALATWGHVSGPEGGVGDLSRGVVRAYAWLGGVDEHGHGGERNLMAVWAKLGLVIYAIESLWHRMRGPRKPMGWGRIMLASWLVALLGYIGALFPTGDLGEATLMLVVFPILAALATAWSIAAHRLADLVETAIRKRGGSRA